MLRSMVFKNFVHFRDVQEIQFERGPNFLFGGNSTGKSVILELIRRSMTTGCNAKISKPFDPTKIAFVFCKFDMSPADLQIWSGVLMLQEICLKIVIEIQSSKTMCEVSKYSVHSQKLTHDNVEVCSFEINENDFSLLKEGWIDNYLDKVFEEVERLYKKIQESPFEKTTVGDISPTDDILKGIEKSFVATFSVRSPSPLQWTRSELIDQSHADENYEEANKRSEIMQDLLPRLQNDETFQDTLNYLCYPIEYNVEINESKITINKQPILKTPIGVYEAIHFSLIIACEEFKTVCLEEPGTGMHPEMIERMRNVLLQRSQNRVFIVVSHSHSFINSWTVPNINVCVRKRVKNNDGRTVIIHQVRSIKGFSDRILDSDDMKKLLFSFKVIGVEGKRDKIILEAFFSYIWETINSPKTEGVPQFQKAEVVLGNHVICLQSKTAAKNTTDFCQLIDLQCSLLLDRDAHVKLQKDKQKIQSIRLESEFKSPFTHEYFDFEEFHGKPLDDFMSEGFERLSHILNSRNVFIWREGGLEDMIVGSLNPKQLEEFKPKEESAKNKSKKKGVEILDLTREQLRTLVIAVYSAGPLKELYDFLSSFQNGPK